MKINNRFSLGQTVRLKTEPPESTQRWVVGDIAIRIDHGLIYGLISGTQYYRAYEQEIEALPGDPKSMGFTLKDYTLH